MPVCLGDRLKEARKAAGLTQRQLANMIGVSNTSISNWEKGVSFPDPDTIQYLCWALKVQPNYFFSFEEEKETLHKKADSEHYNVLKIAGRNGSYQERRLTDQQLAALVAILDQMPDVPDDL